MNIPPAVMPPRPSGFLAPEAHTPAAPTKLTHSVAERADEVGSRADVARTVRWLAYLTSQATAAASSLSGAYNNLATASGNQSDSRDHYARTSVQLFGNARQREMDETRLAEDRRWAVRGVESLESEATRLKVQIEQLSRGEIPAGEPPAQNPEPAPSGFSDGPDVF